MWALKCGVRSLMRAVRIATWTSGEPVSLALRALAATISALLMVALDISRFQLNGTEPSRGHLGRIWNVTVPVTLVGFAAWLGADKLHLRTPVKPTSGVPCSTPWEQNSRI